MQKYDTQHQVSATKEQPKKQLELFKERRFLDRRLKRKIINAFDETHLLEIKEDHIGYNNVSIPDMFKYVFKCYGKVTDADLIAKK